MRMEELFYHGDIVTMEGEQDAPEAVLVRNGIIAAVGSLEEVAAQAGPDCRKTDLQGCTLMPSFIDAHGHVSMTAQYVVMADLSAATCFDDVVRLMKEFQQQRDLFHGEYIFGYSYDHNFLAEQTYPNRHVLDQVSTEVPVAIWHTSVHMAVVNSKALELMGIDKNTPDPEGGVYGREADGTPDGYLEEAATGPLRKLQVNIPMDYRSQIEAAQMKYISHGVTTVQDGAADQLSVASIREMAAEGRLKIDVIAYPCPGFGSGLGNTMEENRDCIKTYVNRFKIGGYKALLDGSPQGKSAWLTRPYENSGDYCGYPWMQDEVIAKTIRQALDENLQILVHCNGDAAGDQLLRVYEACLQESTNPNKHNLRPVMIHCQTAREDQLDKMAELQMLPSIFVAHVNYWGDVHLKNLGQERGSRVSPVNSALKRGMKYNFHTDTPVVKPDMFHTVWAAVNRVTRNGVVSGPEQRISVYDALKGVTIHAAYEYFEENTKGSIKKGKRADLIIVSHNPLKVDPMAIKDIQVLSTYKDGQKLYQKEA